MFDPDNDFRHDPVKPFKGNKMGYSWEDKMNEMHPSFMTGPKGHDTKSKFDLSQIKEPALKGATAALDQLPNLIQNYSTDPTSTQEAGGKSLSMGASMAQIGGAIVPGWGHAAGFLAGTVMGAIDNKGWRQRLLEKEGDETIAKIEDARMQRAEEYYGQKSAEDIKKERNLLAQSMGYSQIG